jgi:hypothetical protein
MFGQNCQCFDRPPLEVAQGVGFGKKGWYGMPLGRQARMFGFTTMSRFGLDTVVCMFRKMRGWCANKNAVCNPAAFVWWSQLPSVAGK